jgi:type IX secretion system PorP/SprF family membrane protein
MKILKGLLFFFFISLAGSMNAQDIHFTQFYLSPLTTNPAYSGAFEGTLRIGGIYRDQWGGVSSSPYRTPSFYVDAPIFMLGKKAWLGVGGMVYSDKAGALELATSQAMGSAAVHIPLNKKSTSIFSIGVQAGYTSRTLNLGQAQFADGLASGNTSTEFGGNVGSEENDFNTNKFDMSVGVLLKAQMNDKMRLEIGSSMSHLLTPDLHQNPSDSLSSDGRDAYDLPGDFTLHGQFFVDLNEKIVIKPAFMFRVLSGANNIQVQAIGGYHLNETKDMTLNVGIGYRLRDATQFIVGMDYKQFRVGAAYDLTVSDLSDVGTGGGFELGLAYTARIFKKPNVKPVIFCPRF